MKPKKKLKKYKKEKKEKIKDAKENYSTQINELAEEVDVRKNIKEYAKIRDMAQSIRKSEKKIRGNTRKGIFKMMPRQRTSVKEEGRYTKRGITVRKNSVYAYNSRDEAKLYKIVKYKGKLRKEVDDDHTKKYDNLMKLLKEHDIPEEDYNDFTNMEIKVKFNVNNINYVCLIHTSYSGNFKGVKLDTVSNVKKTNRYWELNTMPHDLENLGDMIKFKEPSEKGLKLIKKDLKQLKKEREHLLNKVNNIVGTLNAMDEIKKMM